MNEIVLAGCTTTSLSGFLKGIGVVRLVAEQRDPATRVLWRDGRLVLQSSLTPEDLRHFFLHEYRPTPIISPWSGRAGFLEGDDGEESTRKGAATLRKLSASSGTRFEDYRALVGAVRKVSVISTLDKSRAEIKKLEVLEKAKQLDEAGKDALKGARKELKRLKDGLLASLRSELDDTFLPWIDACFVLSDGEARGAPLLGSGGNEGSMDFSVNHVATLLELIDPRNDASSAQMLGHALFAETQPLESTSNVGFLSVAASGGVNMSVGFTADSSENPWTSVLVLEGAVLFAASATKKLGSGGRSGLSFPFMVQPTMAGDGSIGATESAKPELWLPVWDAPASVEEIKALFAEGRSTLGLRQANSGLDMLEALSELGVNRGVIAFERYGFFERRGKGYFVASHLGTYGSPRERADSLVVSDLKQQGWLDHFVKFTNGSDVAGRLLSLRKQLEDHLFDLSGGKPNPAEVQSLLVLLGDIQQALSSSTKAREAVEPVPRLSERWVMAADDGTPEFRIARALAGLRGVGDVALPLRAQLFPVQCKLTQWVTPKSDEKVRIHVGHRGRLIDWLHACLAHRLQLMQRLDMRDKPLASPAGAMLDDVAAFLHDDRMDQRIAALLPGLSLCDIPQDTERGAGLAGMLPAAFGLMKLAITPDRDLRRLGYLAENERLPQPTGMLAALKAGNHGNRAVETARRRLRASGLPPQISSAVPMLTGIHPARAAAALLIPIRWGATAATARQLLELPEGDIVANDIHTVTH